MKEKIKELENEKYIVPGLYRGLNVLEEISRHPSGITLSELTGNIPTATLYRILTTLIKSGYIVREPGDRYRLSKKLLVLGNRGINRNNLVERALPVMRELRDLTGETVLLASLYGTKGVVLAQVESNQAVKVMIEIGHHFPLHSAAPGKAILAFLPEEERKMILDQLTFPRFTEKTIVDPGIFDKGLLKDRKNGFSFDFGEEMEDIRCAGAPILDVQGYPEGAIWISGPASRLPNSKLKKLAYLVKEYAKQIEE